MFDCLIVGGGIAGLTAAVELSQKGVNVCLVEEKSHLGGRAYSFVDPQSGDILDNGQHLIMGCYTSFLQFIKQIGAESKLHRINRLTIPFKHIHQKNSTLHVRGLPQSIAFALAILQFDLITLTERISILRFARVIRRLRKDEIAELDNCTVFDWLVKNKQSVNAINYFWNVICLATLNTDMKYASAKLFAIVLREIFFSAPGATALIFSKRGLSELYVDDAVEAIKKNNGVCIKHDGVRKIHWRENRIDSVTLKDGSHIEASNFIFAIQPQSLKNILPDEWKSQIPFSNLDRFCHSEIHAYYLWSDQCITPEPMTALLGSTLQWIFSKCMTKENQWLFACVISDVDSKNNFLPETISDVREEICRFYPSVQRSAIKHVKRIREKSATFRAVPGLEKYRPPCNTQFENLFLAGDWTSTNLPATLEGAVRSGYIAAGLVKSRLQR